MRDAVDPTRKLPALAEPEPAELTPEAHRAIARELLGQPGPAQSSVDDATLAALGIDPERSPFVSEGMRQDIELYGWAVCPNTRRFVVAPGEWAPPGWRPEHPERS